MTFTLFTGTVEVSKIKIKISEIHLNVYIFPIWK